MKAVRVLCPAKVNLTLEILGKRADGYHELRTVFQAVGLHDELTLTPAEEDSFSVTGLAGAPVDDSNLCMKSLRLWREESGDTTPVAMTLHKRIPMQAGLGGGSSDAAGVLAALRVGRTLRVRHPGIAHTECAHHAADLGSDVPFFLHGGAMLGSGRGDVLEALPPLADGVFVLALPPVRMSTAEAYGLIAPEMYTDGEHTARMAACLRAGCALPEVAAGMYNVFAAPVERHRPEIAALRQRLQELNAQAVLLCGSGAAVCGLFAALALAQEVAARLEAEGFWAAAAEPVPHGVQVTEL